MVRSKSLTYMPALDGIRGVAVLMVFFHHAFPWFGFPGKLGVDIFFVISGWLITRILLKEQAKSGRIKLGSFYLKRLLRLYPALVAMVVFVTLTLWAFDFVVPTSLSDAAIALTYMSNIAMSYFGTFMMPFRHTWSLATEEQFYLIWPLILIGLLALKLSNRTLAIVVGIVAVGGLALRFFLTETPYSPFANTGALLIGCAAAFVVAKKPWQSTPLAYLSVALIGGSMIGFMLGIVPAHVMTTITAVSVPFLIFHAAFGSGPIVWLLSLRWIKFAGVVSYGLYLWHYPILFILRTTTELPGGILGAIAFVLTVAATIASFKLIETPFNRIKDRIGAKEPSPRAIPVPA